MAGRIIYVSDEEFNLLCKHLQIGSTHHNQLRLDHKIIFMRDKFEGEQWTAVECERLKARQKEINEMHEMTREQAKFKLLEQTKNHCTEKEMENFLDMAEALGLIEFKEVKQVLLYSSYLADGSMIRLERWPEGLVLWCGGVIQWKQWVT